MSTGIKMLKNRFVQLSERGAFHIFIGSFLTRFVAFFGSIFLVRVLSKTSYGVLGYIENIYGYIYIFAGMGLGNAILRYVVLAETAEEKHGYYKYVLKKGTLFNIFLILLAGLGSFFYPHPEEFIAARWWLVLILLALPFEFLMDSNIFTYRAMFENKKYAVITFAASTVLIISRYFAAALWDLNGVIFARIAVNTFFGIVLCAAVYKSYFNGHHPSAMLKSDKRSVDKYAVQYMITNGIWAIFMLNDVFLLGIFSGDASIVADYKVAYVLPGNLSIISGAVGVFVAPYFVKHESDYNWVKAKYKKVFGLTAGIMAFAAAILFIFAKPIITILYGTQYKNIVPVMRLLLIAAFANSGLRYTSANLLAAMGQIQYNMAVSFAGVVLQIITSVILIPQYGAMGVASSSIIVYFFMATVLFIVFVKKYNVLK